MNPSNPSIPSATHTDIDLAGLGGVATPHHLATLAGQRAFAAGGSAIDAAIAAAAVLTVVYPHMSGLGGDVQALMALADGKTVAVNGSGAAAQAASAEKLKAEFGGMPVYGPHTITVPGMVAAWDDMHRAAGALPWKTLFKDAIALAGDGVPVPPSLGRDIAALADRLAQDPGMRARFFDRQGRHLKTGDLLVQPELAASLRTIAEHGAECLYSGALGAMLLEGLQQLGSLLEMGDLRAHKTTMLDPVVMRFKETDVLVNPPNSQGFVLLQILAARQMAGADVDPLGDQSALLARLFSLTGWDREQFLADPQFETVDLDHLLSAGHVAELVRIAGNPALPLPATARSPRPVGDTVAITAMDRSGNAITLIQSVYHAFGSGILEPRTGIVCHNRGAGFTVDALPSRIAGGRRPPSSLTPALLRRDGKVHCAVGAMGGKSQPQILAQIIGRVLAGENIAAALAAPRWVVGTFGSQDEEVVLAENSVPSGVRRTLAQSGLPLVVGADRDDRVGHAQITLRDGDRFWSATDPRADGMAPPTS